MTTYNGEPVTILVEYTDQDGDMLQVFHDPGGDAVEDLWLGIINSEAVHLGAVRIPLAKLRDALAVVIPH